ncbi:hypothetical protein H4R35_005935, partial [Dimargaris xerosporica]
GQSNPTQDLAGSTSAPYAANQVAEMLVAVVKLYMYLEGHIPCVWDQLESRYQRWHAQQQEQQALCSPAHLVASSKIKKLLTDSHRLFTTLRQILRDYPLSSTPTPVTFLIHSGATLLLPQFSLLIRFYPVVGNPSILAPLKFPSLMTKLLLRRVMPAVAWQPTKSAGVTVRVLMLVPSAVASLDAMVPQPQFSLNRLARSDTMARLVVNPKSSGLPQAPAADMNQPLCDRGNATNVLDDGTWYLCEPSITGVGPVDFL